MIRKRLAGYIDRRRFLLVLVAVWFVGLFGPLLLGYQRLAFRDVSHFYMPLYGSLGQRMADGGLPLWNPLDRFGVPVAGETTTALFYPPRLIFSCGLAADYAMTLYVVAHLLLAGVAAYGAARWAGANRLASLAAAITYPAAGPVFFLYTNPPFLVGAAWLPWAISGLLRTVRHPSPGSVSVASISLAMAVLGGDPQIALHAALVGFAYWAVLQIQAAWPPARQPAAHARTAASPPSGRVPSRRPRLVPLLGCGLIAAGLSSLQIFPGLAWSVTSWRHHSQPANLYSHLTSLPHRSDVDAEREVAEPPPATPTPATPRAATGVRHHGVDVYDYSVAPWHWAELASPFVSGRLFPIHGRLSQLIPGEPRMWTPTLYAGLLPLLCLLAGPLHPRRWTPWHAMVAAGLILSLGDFGLARLLRGCLETLGLGMPARIPDAAGGGYWALVNLIPGYGQFRFPAKWLPFASLGMAVWGSLFLTRCEPKSWQRAGRLAGVLAVVAAVLLAVTWLPVFRGGLSRHAAAGDFSDPFWGPLDLSAGLRSLRSSLVVTALFATAYSLLLIRPAIPKGFAFFGWWTAGQSLNRRSVIALAVGALVADLALSTTWQLATVGRSPRGAAPGGERITRGLSDRGLSDRGLSDRGLSDRGLSDRGLSDRGLSDGGAAMLRPTEFLPPRRFVSMTTSGDWPASWRSTSSADRLEQVESAQRAVWFMRWHLADSAAVANSAVSIASARTTLFWDEARRYATALPPGPRDEFVESLHRFLAIDATFAPGLPAAGAVAGTAPVRLRTAAVPNPLPLVRWHPEWQSRPPGDDVLNRALLRELFSDILETGGAVRPHLESETNSRLPPQLPRSESVADAAHAAPATQQISPTHQLRLVRWQPERITVHVDAATAGVVTAGQLQDGFWRARLRPLDPLASSKTEWSEVVVYPADVIAQGVLVPAGRHEIEFYYRPYWLLPGLLLTTVTIGGLVLSSVWRLRRRAG